MPVEIISGLYLGNKNDAYDVKFLSSRNINVIINCTNEIPFLKGLNTLELIRIPIRDDFPEEEKEKFNREYYYQFDSLCRMIDRKLRNNKNILIHCRYGKYRSTCLVILYIMFKTKMKLEKVYEIMSCKYPLVKLKKHLFLEALKMYDGDLNPV